MKASPTIAPAPAPDQKVSPADPAALALADAAPEAAAAKAAIPLPNPSRTWVSPMYETNSTVRAMGARDGRLVIAEVGMGPEGVASVVKEVAQQKAATLAKLSGRVDGVDVGAGGPCVVLFPNEGGRGVELQRMDWKGGAPQTVLTKFRGGQHVVNCEGAPMWISPVQAQGRLGGIGRHDAKSGTRAHFAELGPAFALTAGHGRVFFMAHRPSGPDVIYSVNAEAEDLRAHVRMPRGVMALAASATHVYWARLGTDGRSTEFGRVPISGGTPEALGTIDAHVFDNLAVVGDGLVAGTSVVETPGHVVHLALANGAWTAWPGVARVRQVVGEGDGVFVHHESVDGDVPRRVFRALGPVQP